jgi:hypothetical protein
LDHIFSPARVSVFKRVRSDLADDSDQMDDRIDSGRNAGKRRWMSADFSPQEGWLATGLDYSQRGSARPP